MTLSNIPGAVRKKSAGATAQWRAAGLTPAQFRSLTRAGELVRVRRGVYASRSLVESADADPREGHAIRVAGARAAVRAREQIMRDIRLRDAGYKVVHFTWSELFRTPDRVIARVCAAFKAPTSY